MNKYVKNAFIDNSKPTIGADFANKTIRREELKSRSTSCGEGFTKNGNHHISLNTEDSIVLQIWDTTGQEMFRSLNKMYYRGVNGVILVCDLFNKESFKELDGWLSEFL